MGQKWRSMPENGNNITAPRIGNEASSQRNGWYALRVRDRSEARVAQVLNLKQYRCFLPCWEKRKRYSDRIVRVSAAAFPGYLFCQLDPDDRVGILNTPGVQSILGTAGYPEAIGEDVILALQKAFSSGRSVLHAPYMRSGCLVRVQTGPMTGIIGRLVRVKGQDQLVISVNLLGRSVSVELNSDSVDVLQ